MISALADTIMLTDKHIGGPNGTITRVVVHGTVSPCVRGGARNNARYFQSPKAGGAAHYVVDPGEIVACVDEDRVAFHAPPNQGSIGVEFCDPQTGDPARWSDADHLAMLQHGGRLIADICARLSLPTVYLATADLLAGAYGITGHVNVAEAWHKSDHTDPRDLPIDVLMGFVAPALSPQLPEDDDMNGRAIIHDSQGHTWIFRRGANGMIYFSRDGGSGGNRIEGSSIGSAPSAIEVDGVLIVGGKGSTDDRFWAARHNVVDPPDKWTWGAEDK